MQSMVFYNSYGTMICNFLGKGRSLILSFVITLNTCGARVKVGPWPVIRLLVCRISMSVCGVSYWEPGGSLRHGP